MIWFRTRAVLVEHWWNKLQPAWLGSLAEMSIMSIRFTLYGESNLFMYIHCKYTFNRYTFFLFFSILMDIMEQHQPPLILRGLQLVAQVYNLMEHMPHKTWYKLIVFNCLKQLHYIVAYDLITLLT